MSSDSSGRAQLTYGDGEGRLPGAASTGITGPSEPFRARLMRRAKRVYEPSAVSFVARKVDAASSPAAKLFSASQPPSTVSAMPFTYADWSLAR